MNREPLARAIAAACITIALLGSGMLLARSALGALPQQSLQPDEFLPLIVQPRQSPAASPTTTTTATTTATASPTTTTTATTTATASPTTTATATATATTIPTSDPLATSQLLVTNHTGFPLSFTLSYTKDGPDILGGDVAPNTTLQVSIRPDHYWIRAFTQCRYSAEEFTVATNLSFQVSYVCP